MTEVKQFWTETMRNNMYDPKDRLKASELIAKTNGAFIEKVEHSGNVKVFNPLENLTTEELKKLIDK